jgi:hypothetical protein
LIYSANGERPRAALLLNTKVSRDSASAIIEVPTEKGTQRIVAAAGKRPTYRHEGLDGEEVIDLTLACIR